MVSLPDASHWEKVRDVKDSTNWVLLTFKEGSKKDLEAKCGEGGMEEFLNELRADQVHFGGFVVYGVDHRGQVTSKREKFVTVSWVGEGVKVMAKARVSSQRGAVKSYFDGSHLDFQISEVADLEESDIIKRLLQSGGAHKPQYYDFGGKSGEAANAAHAGETDGEIGGEAKAGETAAAADGEKERRVLAAKQVDADAAAEQEAAVAKAKAIADEEKERRVLAAKQMDADAAAVKEAGVAKAKEAADAEQARRVAEDEAILAAAKAEREAAQAEAKAASDAEQAQRISEPGPDVEQLQVKRKLSIEAAAASPAKVKVEVDEVDEGPKQAAAVFDAGRKKWTVDGAVAGEPVYIRDTKMMHTVYIVDCVGATIIVEGKVNGVCIDHCTKTQVLVDTVISAVEVVNGKQISFQVNKHCPSAAVDNTDGCAIYLMSEESQKMDISTSKHSDVQVNYNSGEEMIEKPVPEQFVHTINAAGKLTSSVSDLYSS